jgi:hypothetical protein
MEQGLWTDGLPGMGSREWESATGKVALPGKPNEECLPSPGVIVHTYISSTWEAEIGGL